MKILTPCMFFPRKHLVYIPRDNADMSNEKGLTSP